jgi:hypothetical protein
MMIAVNVYCSVHNLVLLCFTLHHFRRFSQMKKALALFLVLALALTAVSAGFAQDDLSGELEIFSWLGR